MFLKELWHFDKKLTVYFLLFISTWLFLNIKQGAVATPVLQYGMYSENYHRSDTLKVIRLYINNKPLNFSTLSMSARDQLQVSLENYLLQQQKNESVFNNMQRIFNKVGIGQWMKKEVYTNAVTDKQFTDWYVKLAEKITGEKIVALSAFQQKFTWQNGQLTAAASPEKLDCIVAY